MKTAEDYIRQINSLIPHPYNLSRKKREEIKSLIREIQKEAYNQAIDDALEEIDDYKLEYDDFNYFSEEVSLILNKDKQSILKLKK